LKERHWNSLVAAVRRGQCVLVIGPEIPVSIDGRLIAEGINDRLMQVLARELQDDGQTVGSRGLAAVAQQYEDSDDFGAAALRASVEKALQSGAFEPTRVHALLAELPFPLVLATAQDGLLEQALQAAGKTPLRHRYHLRGDRRDNPEFVVPGTPNTPLLFHLFGLAKEPMSQVLSENDIMDFLIAIVAGNPPLPNGLLRALKRPGLSFLFIGFGIRHWYLRLLLKLIMRTFDVGRGVNAVAAEPLAGLPVADRDDTILFCRRGTRVEVEDSDLETFLATLVQRVAQEGGYAGGTAVAAGVSARIFISHAREDAELAVRLHDALRLAQFDPWLDRYEMVGGEQWDLHIESELQTTDFVLVLHTPALCGKTDSYINKEIYHSRRRAQSVRGSFLVPLCTAELNDEQRVRELAEYQEMSLRPHTFNEDMAQLVSMLRREFQRRQR
jgi:hypothetical protein